MRSAWRFGLYDVRDKTGQLVSFPSGVAFLHLIIRTYPEGKSFATKGAKASRWLRRRCLGEYVRSGRRMVKVELRSRLPFA